MLENPTQTTWPLKIHHEPKFKQINTIRWFVDCTLAICSEKRGVQTTSHQKMSLKDATSPPRPTHLPQATFTRPFTAIQLPAYPRPRTPSRWTKIPTAEHTKHTLLPSTVAKFYGHNMFMCHFIHHESHTHLTGVEPKIALRPANNLPG
jgi:hypothetical protein